MELRLHTLLPSALDAADRKTTKILGQSRRLSGLPNACTELLCVCVWRDPQQTLRTHRSLKAYCATLWWRWLVFFVFPCNGSLVEWNWQAKTCPSAILSATNPTWTDPGSNPGLRGDRPATDRLSRGTACTKPYSRSQVTQHGGT